MRRGGERGRHGRRDGRARRMLPITALAPPPNGPARLVRAVRIARVRQALGRELGRRLAALQETERELTLVFEDDAWASASRRQVGPIAQALGPILRKRRLVIASLGSSPARRSPRE